MVQLFTLVFLLTATISFSQDGHIANNSSGEMQKASFVSKIDIRQATKDGIYLNGYVVNMSYEKIRALNGQTVRITGKVTIVKGIAQYNGEEAIQGREGDIMYIKSPTIKIVGNGKKR